MSNGMIQILLLLLLPLLFLQHDRQLSRNSCAAAVRLFFAHRYVKASIGFSYFPSVALLSCAANLPCVNEALFSVLDLFQQAADTRPNAIIIEFLVSKNRNHILIAVT